MSRAAAKRGRFSLVEVAIAGFVLAAALGPLIAMMVDARLRMAAVERRRAALALADDVLAWAVTAADSGEKDRPPKPSLPSFEVAVGVRQPSPGLELEIVTAAVSWPGRWGRERIELESLRIKP